MAETINVRDIVLEILVENEVHHTYSNLLIRNAQDRYDSLTLSERSFLKRLAEGCIERKDELDSVINRHLAHPENRLKPAVRCTLRMGVYQIYYMDSVTDYAAVDEAVKLLRKRRLNDQTGFVNGVLRSICRDKAAADKGVSMVVQTGDGRQQTIYKRRKTVQTVVRTTQNKTTVNGAADNQRAMSRTYSMPQEILDLWNEDLGEDETRRLCEAMLEIRPVTIRMDVRRSAKERQQVLDAMTAAGIQVTPARWLPAAYHLTHTGKIQEMPGYADGVYTVQDESSQLAAYATGLAQRSVDPNGAQPFVILDLCAAPGGKSMAAASLAPDAEIHSYDLSQAKTDQIRVNIARMQYTNITVAEHDATEYDASLKACADLVICDVPCSGLGVITHKRDIKYNITRGRIRSLVSLQREILRNAASYVRPGGVLLYSTCTIDRQENERQAAWIAKELGLIPDNLAPFLPADLPNVNGNMVQLLPHVHGTDGFYMARFIKK